MIEVKDLTKKYGSHTAVKGISFTIDEGKIYGLLGPNGAGKSTTMNIITGCLAATSGSVTVNCHDIFEEPLEAKSCIGYLPELPPVYDEMTPKEYLFFVAEAKRVPYEKSFRQVKEVTELTGLVPVENRLIRNLSKGYRQRVGIAQAMIGDPDIIILDEPTVGLDPQQIIEIRELIKSLGKIKTVVISSHILAEISEICDHVLIISDGRLVADSSLDSLEETAIRDNGLTVKLYSDTKKVMSVLGSVPGVTLDGIVQSDGVVTAVLKGTANTGSEDLRRTVAEALAAAGVPVMEIRYPTLESIFLELTQKQDDDNDTDEGQKENTASSRRGFFSFFKKKSGEAGEEEEYVPQFAASDDSDDNNSDNDDTKGGDGE